MTIRTLTIAAALIGTVAAASAINNYTVRKGDSLHKVAKRFGVSVESLRAANRLKTSNRLRVGQIIQIPSKTPPRLGTAEILIDQIKPHAGPFDGSKQLTPVSKGGEVIALSQRPGWVKLQFAGGAGWLPESAIKLTPSKPIFETTSIVQASSAAASKIVKNHNAARVAAGVENPILKQALGYKGVRYRWGGTSRAGVDCSGFTSSVFRSQGIKLPRTSIQQSHVGDPVSKGELQPGDLVFFRTSRSYRINHVGIYVGDGKFIHAATGAGHVKVSSLGDPYYKRAYATARRVADFNVAARASRILDDASQQ